MTPLPPPTFLKFTTLTLGVLFALLLAGSFGGFMANHLSCEDYYYAAPPKVAQSLNRPASKPGGVVITLYITAGTNIPTIFYVKGQP